MAQPTPSQPEAAQFDGRAKSGANWFFWIAALSLVNTIAAFSGSDWRFIVGTGVTQVVDAMIMQVSGDAAGVAKVVALVFDIFVAVVFVALGLLARKRHQWAFIVGMVGYGMDGLIFLLVKDWISIAFHVFAVWCIYAGLRASRQLAQLPAAPPPLAAPPVA